jgi:hypothetical protein
MKPAKDDTFIVGFRVYAWKDFLKEENLDDFIDFNISCVKKKKYYFVSLGNNKIKPASFFVIPRKQYQATNRPKKPKLIFELQQRLLRGTLEGLALRSLGFCTIQEKMAYTAINQGVPTGD